VNAEVDALWEAWTTEEGLKSFFAPECNLDLRVGGAFELLFDLDAEPGRQGSEGTALLAIQPKVMLSFTWNAPPHLPNVREHFTHVVVRFRELAPARTEVALTHNGWGEGEEWDTAYDYFTRAWNDVVLPRLAYRFSVGPVNWDDPPTLERG
jgi:uncharacterized protein YndB with AHSA1/START domain